MSTSRTFCSGVTRAITPISSISSSASSSLSSANCAPEIARPSIPSSRAIASAVIAWSPVIIRTWIPASCAVAIAALAAGRGGSTIPTSASSVSSVHQREQVGAGSKSAGSKSLRAVAITRRPFAASRSFSAR